MPHDKKITRYIEKTLLDFVEIYLFMYCYTVFSHYTSMFISYAPYDTASLTL